MAYAVLLASVLIQICLGGLYAWSSFTEHLMDPRYGFTKTQTQVLFGWQIATFAVAMIPAGWLLRQHGPRVVSTIGGLLFGGGYAVASLSGGSFWIMFVGIALVSGAGLGFCYVCPLAVCIKWFPRHKGLVTGVAVAGFGGGAILLAYLAEWLLKNHKLDVLTVFLWAGLLYTAIIVAASMVLHNPPAPKVVLAKKTICLSALLRDRFFWALALGTFCGTFAGLLVIGNLRVLADRWQGVAGVLTALSVGNASGRLIWGWLTDRLEERTIPLTLLFLACAVGMFLIAGDSLVLMTIAAAMTGFGFSACFVSYPWQVGVRYGTDRVASVYPLIFLTFGLSGMTGPVVGGWFYDQTASILPGVGIGVVVVLIGWLGYSRLTARTETWFIPSRARHQPPGNRPASASSPGANAAPLAGGPAVPPTNSA